jgi:hypothetical protein
VIEPRYLRILDRIHHDPALFFFLIVFPVSCLASLLIPKVFTAAEHFGSRLSERKRLCILLLAITPIVLRVSLISVTPIPFPRAHDEFSYLLAADTFSHDRLTNPPHPMQLYLDTFHTIQQPTYMSMYPPAQGAVLAVGELLGNPWIGVLLSVSVMCGAILWALQGWLAPRWALLGGILAVFQLAISTYWVNSYWGGAVAAIGGVLTFGALPRIVRSSRVRDVLLLGLGVAILANSRPLEGLIFSLPVLIALGIWIVRRQGPSRQTAFLRVVLPFCGVMLLCMCLMGYYNFRLTGHATLFPHDMNIHSHYAVPLVAWDKTVAPFHFRNPQFEAFFNQWWPTHSWPAGQPNSVVHIVRAFALDILKFAWFYLYPALLVAVLATPWILRDRRMRFPVALVLSCFAGFLLVAWFMPHYAAPLTATVFLLIVQGLRHLRQWRFRAYLPGVDLSRAAVISTLLLSLIPNKTINSPHSVLEYRSRMTSQLTAMPGDDLIIVHYSPDHDPNTEWVYNAADIDHAKIVWAREIPGVPLQPLLSYFHGRRLWLLNADGQPPTLSSYTPSADPLFVQAQTDPGITAPGAPAARGRTSPSPFVPRP